MAITPACTCTFFARSFIPFSDAMHHGPGTRVRNSKFKPFPIFQRSCKRTISSRSLINARTKAQLQGKRRETQGRKRGIGVSLPFYQAKGANIRTMNWDKLSGPVPVGMRSCGARRYSYPFPTQRCLSLFHAS